MRSRDTAPAQTPMVWVEDRYGTMLPYSKGLMAASIMATGLSPEVAYMLAGRVEDRLRSTRATRVRSELLITTAADVVRSEAGQEVCDRYLAWRSAKRSPSPVVVLIGGAAGVGKSTVATKLAARLDLTRVVTTDTVRQIMRGFLSPDDAPEIHRSSFEQVGSDHIDEFLAQSDTVMKGVSELVSRMVTERKDVIVEGVHLVPGGLSPERLAAMREVAVVSQVLLVLEDPDIHRSHFLHRLENEHGRDPQRYLRHFDVIRQVQDGLVDLAVRHGVPTVDGSSLDDAIQSVITVVVAEVLASGSSSSVAVGS